MDHPEFSVPWGARGTSGTECACSHVRRDADRSNVERASAPEADSRREDSRPRAAKEFDPLYEKYGVRLDFGEPRYDKRGVRVFSREESEP